MCSHGQYATGKGNDSAYRTKEKGEIVKYWQIRYTFGKRRETEDVCFPTSNQLIFNQWSWATHLYYPFLVNVILRWKKNSDQCNQGIIWEIKKGKHFWQARNLNWLIMGSSKHWGWCGEKSHGLWSEVTSGPAEISFTSCGAATSCSWVTLERTGLRLWLLRHSPLIRHGDFSLETSGTMLVQTSCPG